MHGFSVTSKDTGTIYPLPHEADNHLCHQWTSENEPEDKFREDDFWFKIVSPDTDIYSLQVATIDNARIIYITNWSPVKRPAWSQ